MDVPIAANVLGTTGAICWSIQLLPQIIINYRRHHATGLQPSMMMLWAWAGVPLGVYNIVQEFNIALRIQPQILTLLSLATWMQCYYYQKKWHPLRAFAAVMPIALVMGGIEASLIFALRKSIDRGLSWPLTLMAAMSAALLAAGVLRHYWDIYVHRTVRGISFIFVGIDAAGDLFSLVSVFFQPVLDVQGMIIYAVELVLWLGVFACGGYFNLMPWIKRRMRGDAGSRTSNDRAPGEGLDHAEHENTIALHSLGSSTSVFRTPSNEIAAVRARSSA